MARYYPRQVPRRLAGAQRTRAGQQGSCFRSDSPCSICSASTCSPACSSGTARLIDKRPGVTRQGVLRNWGLVFLGNFAGAFTVAVLMAIVFTYRLLAAARHGRAGDRPHRRGPHRRLRRARRRRHAHAVRARHDVQLDGLHRRGRRHDLHRRARQGDRDVDADHGVLLSWGSSIRS